MGKIRRYKRGLATPPLPKLDCNKKQSSATGLKQNFSRISNERVFSDENNEKGSNKGTVVAAKKAASSSRGSKTPLRLRDAPSERRSPLKADHFSTEKV
jgi:hypothetical protein